MNNQPNATDIEPSRTASTITDNQNDQEPLELNATAAASGGVSAVASASQVEQLMQRVVSMHDHFQNASRIQSTIQQQLAGRGSPSDSQGSDQRGNGSDSVRGTSPTEQPTVRLNDLQLIHDTQLQTQAYENNATEGHLLSTVREEARINRHRDALTSSDPDLRDSAAAILSDAEALQAQHLMQTQRMNFQELPQEDDSQIPIASNASEIDINMLRALNAGDNGGRPSQLPAPSSLLLLGRSNTVGQQMTTEPPLHPNMISRSPLLAPSTGGIIGGTHSYQYLNSTSNIGAGNSREARRSGQAGRNAQQALQPQPRTAQLRPTPNDNNLISGAQSNSSRGHNHSNSHTQQNLQQYLARLRNIRDRQIHNSSSALSSQPNNQNDQTVPTERTIQIRPNNRNSSSQPDLPQPSAPRPHVQNPDHIERQTQQNEPLTGQQQIQSRQQQQFYLINTEDNPHRGTGRIIQNLLNINQAQPENQIQAIQQIQMNQQQQHNEGAQSRPSASSALTSAARGQAANQAVNSSSTNYSTLTSQATRIQASEYAGHQSNPANAAGRSRAADGGADRARQSNQDQTSQSVAQNAHMEEGRSAGSTQRERYNSTSQQQQQSWPPVELYQQIDALIQQSSLQQQAQHDPPQSVARQPDPTTQNGQAQILRSILRNSGVPSAQQQNQPASSASIPHPIAPSTQDDLNLMGPQHSSLDDSMSMQITQQQILDSITSNRNTLQDTQESNLLHHSGNLRLGGSGPSNSTQRLVTAQQRRQIVAGAPNHRNSRPIADPIEDSAVIDGADGHSQSTMNEEQMNEIINGGGAGAGRRAGHHHRAADDSSSQGSDDGAGGMRMGILGRNRGRDDRLTRGRDDRMMRGGTGSSNHDEGRPLPNDPSGNRNIQISSVQEQLRQRHQEILGREPRWTSGAGPLESDDDYDDDMQSNLILSANRANANRIDTDNSSNPSPPLASYNVNTSSQHRNNSRQVNFAGASSSDDDSNDDDESNNTSHEENMIAADPSFRRQQESNLNLRAALGIRNSTSNQMSNIQEQNRQNVFNRIISSHMNREQIESGNQNNRNSRLQNSQSNGLAATGANGYPILDDLDLNDNDDAVSMNDSLNMLVINNTNIQGNGRRQIDSGSHNHANQSTANWNQNNAASILQDLQINSSSNNNLNRRDSMMRSSAIRQMREEQKSNANQNIEEIFKCFICYGKIQDAVLCPSCSKLACRDCLRKWLTEQRQQCPHCRSHLSVDRLINCRFVEEITAAIDTLNKSPPESARNGTLPDGNLLRNGNEICKDHGQRLDYFCQTCKVPICSECAMFGNSHKEHKFMRLQEVYEKHCEVIKKEAIGLKKRLKELTKYTKDVETTIEKVTKAKEEKSKEIENFNENIQHKLNTKLKNKLLTLWAQRQSMQDEIEQLEEFHNKLHLELTKMPKTSLIKKSGDLIRQLKEIHTKEPHKFIDNEVSIDFSSDIVPEYEQSVFVIKNFSRIRQSQSNQIQDDNEIVYSDPPLVTKSGLTWRLKVYPNGNGIAKGNYISVFLEMLKGLPEQQTQKYEYRVEMINHRTPSAQVVREFASEFEVGECWGYNRFYRIDLLDREGYLNTVDDSITLKFFVRAPCYSQHCQDQERHITNLQKQIESQSKEMEELKEKLSQAQRQLKKRSSKAAKKLRAVNPSNGQQIQEESLEEIDASQDEENSNELDDKQKSLLEFHDCQKVQSQKLNSHQYLKDLKEKQKKNDQRVNYNQQQISSMIGSRKSKPYPHEQASSSHQNSKSNNPFVAESKGQESHDKHASITSSRHPAAASLNQPSAPAPPGTQQDEAATFAQSSLAPAVLESRPTENSKRKDEIIKLDFYSKSQVKRDSYDEEEDKQNESNDSNTSNKLLVQFKHDMSGKKKYAKHNYVSEDNYDKILNDFKKNSDSGNSSQKDKNEKDIDNIQRKNKNEIMSNCLAPFKSDDESNQSDQQSIDSSSQNDEEKKEKQQYKVLKESLRQLQNRANATLCNQQKLIMSGGSGAAEGSPKEGQNKSLTNINFAQNYSVSSGQDDENDNGDTGNNVMQDSNYDDQGISASGSDNQSSGDGQEPSYNAQKFNIFGSPNVSTSNKKQQLPSRRKQMIGNNEDEEEEQEVEEDDDAQMIMTSASPNVVSRLGIGLATGEIEPAGAENSFYVQSSNHSYDGQSNHDDDGVKILGDQPSKRQFKVRDPEELGSSLAPSSIEEQRQLTQSQLRKQLENQQSSLQGRGNGPLNDSIENQGNLTKAISGGDNANQKQMAQHSQGSQQSSHSLKIQQLRKLAQNHQEAKQNFGASQQKESQISSKFNFEQIQSPSTAQATTNEQIQNKFEERKSQHGSSKDERIRAESQLQQQQISSQKLNQINERVLEKKKLSQQLSVKGIHSSVAATQSSQHSSQPSSTSLNFKKLATSNSSQLKLGGIQHSQGQSSSVKNTNSGSATPLQISGLNSNSQQQQQHPSTAADASNPPSQAPQSQQEGLAGTSSNQKLLAGLNQLKQKRMLKQTMTLPNQSSAQQKKE